MKYDGKIPLDLEGGVTVCDLIAGGSLVAYTCLTRWVT